MLHKKNATFFLNHLLNKKYNFSFFLFLIEIKIEINMSFRITSKQFRPWVIAHKMSVPFLVEYKDTISVDQKYVTFHVYSLFDDKDYSLKVTCNPIEYFNEVDVLEKLDEEIIDGFPTIAYNYIVESKPVWLNNDMFKNNKKFYCILHNMYNIRSLSIFKDKDIDWDEWKKIFTMCFYCLYEAEKIGFCHGNITFKNIRLRELDDEDEDEERVIEFDVEDVTLIIKDYNYEPCFVNFNKSFLNNEKILDEPITDLQYRAPEMFFFHLVDDIIYTDKSDVFSLGVILGSIYYKEDIFDHFCKSSVPNKIIEDVTNLIDEDEKYKIFLTDPRLKLVTMHIWKMINTLGMPSNKRWKGIEKTRLWKIFDNYFTTNKITHPVSCLSEDGGSELLIKFLLNWSQASRPDLSFLMRESSFFRDFSVL